MDHPLRSFPGLSRSLPNELNQLLEPPGFDCNDLNEWVWEHQSERVNWESLRDVEVEWRPAGRKVQELGFYAKRKRWEDAAVRFAFFFFPLNYKGFLLKLVVNLITYNILRRFSTTVFKCVSQNTLILTIITKMPLYHFLSQFLYNRRRNDVVKSYFCSSDKFSLKVVWSAYAYFLLNY